MQAPVAFDRWAPQTRLPTGHGNTSLRTADAGASFNRALVESMGAITAKDTRAVGATWTFAPILDIATHPAWSRVFEVP